MLSDICEADEIANRGEETVILYTDDYIIYHNIDEYDRTDAYLAITHDDTYVIGDTHVNSCENARLPSPMAGEVQSCFQTPSPRILNPCTVAERSHRLVRPNPKR